MSCPGVDLAQLVNQFAGRERVRVIPAEHPLPVRKQRLEQPQRLPSVSALAGPVGDGAAGRELWQIVKEVGE